jgi:aryl-alcohol dehydrogenase-like predicted oxidoreductase
MQTRSLGPGAPDVAAVGFGGMPLSTDGRPEEALGLRVIHAVLDAGVTLLDTADVYCLDDDDIGHNERLFAKALDSWPGSPEDIVVATKGGMTRPGGRWGYDGHPDHLQHACERSLRALGVECIDLYQFHTPDPSVPFADSVGAFARLREEGKIRCVGLSNVTVEQIEEARSIAPVAAVQNRLSPFFREAVQTGVVQHCTEHGIGFLAYSPVGGGRLHKKLPSHPVVGPIAERLGASTHAVVQAWVLAQGPNVIPIPAARTVEHALDSVKSETLELTPEDLAAIDVAEFSIAR